MNLLLLEPPDMLSEDEAEVRGRRARHLRQTLGAAIGSRVRAGLVDGLVGHAEVLAIDEERARLRVSLTEPPPAPALATIALAMPRPKSLPRILATIASFGAKEIWLMHSYRVEKAYWHCEQLGEASVREALLRGLEQARDTRLPRLRLRRRFKPFVEDEMPALARACPGRAFVAHPAEGARHCPGPTPAPALLAVGPEGGFIPYEIELLAAAGLEAVRLGERPLRTEAAVAALLGRLLP